MTTEPMNTNLKSRIEEMRGDLQAMLGENRLQRHLLRMELHDRFDDFERRYAELHDALGKARAETVESLRASIAELSRSFDAIRSESMQTPHSAGTPGVAAPKAEKPTRASGETEC
jgi:predicted nuclease with TOPRIM domain